MTMYHHQEIIAALQKALEKAFPNVPASPWRRGMALRGQPRPALYIIPGKFVQPNHAGTNRTYQQVYRTKIIYVADAPVTADGLLEAARLLVDTIMADPYCGETCWHSQVTEVTTGTSAVIVKVEGKRAEVWDRMMYEEVPA